MFRCCDNPILVVTIWIRPQESGPSGPLLPLPTNKGRVNIIIIIILRIMSKAQLLYHLRWREEPGDRYNGGGGGGGRDYGGRGGRGGGGGGGDDRGDRRGGGGGGDR